MRRFLALIYNILNILFSGMNYLRILIIYNSLLKSQYWSRKKIASHQLKHYVNLINKVLKHSKYYLSKYKDFNISSIDINNLLHNTPVLHRTEIMENENEIIVKDYAKKTIATTSGSTGEPLSVSIAPLAIMYRFAGRKRFYSWWGISDFDKSVLIWGKKGGSNGFNDTLTIKLKRFLRNRIDIDVFTLNKNTIVNYLNCIVSFKPKFVRGYKSGILQFAELTESAGLSINIPSIKVVIVTSEVLLDNERAYIEKVFKCKVANEYGAAEAGLFGFDCPHGRMHIFEESVLMHTNTKRELFVTELFNDSMPLINYKNNDIVHISDDLCTCGRTLRVIDKVEGRLNDYIIKPDGSKLSQYVLYYIFKELEDIGYNRSVKKYKVIQKQTKFDIYIVPDINYSVSVEEYILTKLNSIIGDDIKVSFILSESIQLEPSGKLRFFKRDEI